MFDAWDELPDDELTELVALADGFGSADAQQSLMLVHEPVHGVALPRSECWGSEACGTELPCDTNFKIAGHYLKDKFCRRCREDGNLVPISRIRAIGQALHATFSNSTSEGLWSSAAGPSTVPKYRLINHTQGCNGPRMLLFYAPPPDVFAWAEVPIEWQESGTFIRLWVSKGTLVPMRPRTRPYNGRLPAPKRQQRAAVGPGDRVASGDAIIMPISPTASGDAIATAIGPDQHQELVAAAHHAWVASCEQHDRSSPASSTEALSSVSGADGDTAVSVPHSPFVARFISAHANLRSMIEERLGSAEPISSEQRETLLEQVSGTLQGHTPSQQ